MPKINRITARRAPIGPRPDPDAFGAVEGRALASFGSAVSGLGEAVTREGKEIADIKDGYQQQLAVSRYTEAEDNLRRFSEDLAQDPDFQGREKRFTDRASELREELGRDISPGPRKFEFENALKRASNRHGVTVRSTALRDEMSSAELMANDTARRLATVAATSESPFDQHVARLEGEGIYLKLGERFGIDPARIDEAIRQFNLEVDDAIYTNQLRTDPVAAYRALRVPEQGLAKGRTEVERQTMLTKTLKEIESQLRSMEQIESSEDRLRTLRRKEANRVAEKSLIKLSQTPGGVTEDDVNKVSDALDPNSLGRWLQRARDGGRIKPSKLNVTIYKDIRARAMKGEDVTDEVFEEEDKGNLTTSARDALLNQSDDTRFGIADEMLERVMEVSESTGSPAIQARNARAISSYEIWKVEHPNASRDEAMARVYMEIERATITERGAKSIRYQLPPQNAVYESDGETLNVEQTEEALQERYNQSQQDRDPEKTENFSEPELERELDLVERYKNAQEAQRLLMEIKAQQAEARK